MMVNFIAVQRNYPHNSGNCFMNRIMHSWMWLSIAMVVLLCQPLMAADDTQSVDQSPKANESVVKPADTKHPEIQPAKKTPNSPLAPGVMITIDPDRRRGRNGQPARRGGVAGRR